MDEIIRTLREVDKMFGSAAGGGKSGTSLASSTSGAMLGTTSTTTTHNAIIKQLLSVQHKHLNASYEIKRMFGHKVVQAEQ